MKTFKVIVKIVLALAAIAGVVYVVATYGDRIVAWARKLLNRAECECCCDCDCDCEECDCEDDCENCQCECSCDCSCDCDESCVCDCADVKEEDTVVAEQTDFEG